MILTGTSASWVDMSVAKQKQRMTYGTCHRMGLLLIGALMLDGCARPSETPSDIDPALLGVTWVLTSIEGREPTLGQVVTLEFRSTEIVGSMPCNNYRAGPGDGVYRVLDGDIRWGLVSETVELCLTPEGIMDDEAAYMEAFRDVRAYEVTAKELKLFDEEGGLLLVYRVEKP